MFVNRYVNRKCVMWVLTKKSFKVTSNPPNLTVLFDEFSGWIREFAVPTMAAATARAGHRTPMALHRYSFGLHLIWNRVFEPFSMDLWWKSQSRKCWPRSGFEDFIFFSVKWQCSSQLDGMKQFCFDDFFSFKYIQQRNENPDIQEKHSRLFTDFGYLQSFHVTVASTFVF